MNVKMLTLLLPLALAGCPGGDGGAKSVINVTAPTTVDCSKAAQTTQSGPTIVVSPTVDCPHDNPVTPAPVVITPTPVVPPVVVSGGK